jgi:hypothetical protein
MADHLKSVMFASPSDPQVPLYAQVSDKGSWGGYISDTSGQTNTNADFAYYSLSSSSDYTYDTAEWVGIGGVHGALLQGGVQLSNKQMWWEAVDANGNLVDSGFDPNTADIGNVGDIYTTEVIRTGVGVWEVIDEDITSGKAYDSGNLGFSPDHTMAEWVMEYLGWGYHSVPSLSSSVPYTGVWFDDVNYNQHNVAYANTYYKQELYYSGFANCIKPGTLTNDTSTISHFTDNWTNSGC